MPLLLLMCVMLACLPFPWPAPPFGLSAWGSALATGALVLLFLGASELLARTTAARLTREPEHRLRTLERYGTWRVLHFFALLGLFGAALYSLGWGWTIQNTLIMKTSRGEPTPAPGAEFVVLLPFFLMQVGSWVIFYRVARRAHDTSLKPEGEFWGRWGYVLFHFRQNLILPYGPLILCLGAQALFRLYPGLEKSPWVEWGALVLGPAILLLIPLALPRLLGLRSLSAGPLRQRMEVHARRL